MSIFINNQSCISFQNPTFYAYIMLIEIQHYFIHEKIELDKINFFFCRTKDMIVDNLTKSLTCEKHSKFKEMIRIIKLN